MFKKLLTFSSLMLIVVVLAACGGPPATEAPAEAGGETTVEQPKEEPMAMEKVHIRWFVGLGTGGAANQVVVQEEVVADFNASQDHIELVLDVARSDPGRLLSAQIAAGVGPDIVGPVGWGGSNDFYGQWLDIAPYMEAANFDDSIFDPALINFFQTEEGQVGLPFAVYPGAMFFQPAMFDKAGLEYPPQVYGEMYVLDGQAVEWNWDTITEIAKRLTLDVNGYNATEPEFDRKQIVQVGYYPQFQSLQSIGTFYGGAAKLYSGNAQGSYEITIPDSWKAGWQWYYTGMWGDEPYILTGPMASSGEFGNWNVFGSGKAAMGLAQTWYTGCCLDGFRDAGFEFQLGIQPYVNGKVAGRMDADTFRIWKGTPHPEEAFEALAYLVTTGGDKLLPVYGAMPAIASKTDAFFDIKSNEYPFVTPESWNVLVQGLAYPDSPSSEQYLPNLTETYNHFDAFYELLDNTPPEKFDFEAEFNDLAQELNLILNK